MLVNFLVFSVVWMCVIWLFIMLDSLSSCDLVWVCVRVIEV